MGFGLGELGLGLGVVELGLGLGVVELGLGLGVVVELGVGVFVAGVDDEDEDAVAEVDVVGLDEGLALPDLGDEADELGVAELADLVADLVGVADELADLKGVAEEPASAAAGPWLAALVLAAESFVVFGMSGQDADLMID